MQTKPSWEVSKKERVMDDKRLRDWVIDELDWDPSIDALSVGVAVADGVVMLSGHVHSYAERFAVEQAVRRVKGVKAIAEDLELRPISAKKTADDEIAKRASDTLTWDASVPHQDIQIKVHQGHVTLSGVVEWQFQRLAAEQAVRKLGGVIGISNLITLKPKAAAPDIKRRIEEALRRTAEAEANAVRVSVADGKVTLEGKVRAFYERGLIETAAWAAPGVRAVEDRVQVTG
jgi:osmotically-inducible protein OsmY